MDRVYATSVSVLLGDFVLNLKTKNTKLSKIVYLPCKKIDVYTAKHKARQTKKSLLIKAHSTSIGA